MKKMILLLMPFIALCGCKSNTEIFEKVDFDTFKEKVESLTTLETVEYKKMTLNGYMNYKESNHKWNNKVLNMDDPDSISIADLNALMIISLNTYLDFDNIFSSVNSYKDTADFFISENNNLKMVNNEENDIRTIVWNDKLLATQVIMHTSNTTSEGVEDKTDLDLRISYVF